jgi:hypothetical protein
MLAGLLAAVVFAQQDPFAGIFQGDKVALELKGSGGKYTGTLTVQGASFPATVIASGATANGTFVVGGRAYAFTLAPYGNGFKLASEGVEYLLTRKVEAQSPPVVRTPPPAPPPAPVPAPPTVAKQPVEEPPSPAGAIATPAAAPQSIVGAWRNAQINARFNADGTGTMNGENGRYITRGDQLTMMGAQGQVTIKYAVQGDQLTLTGPGGSAVLDRVKQEAGAGSIHMELVGKWCWVSQVYANNGGARQSNRCITLNGNGSYEYFGLTDSYNPYGGATSQRNESGAWTATETSLTTRSAGGRVTTYTLEKRNHPKNVRDPMIVLNGEPFVTFYNKPPW